MQLLKKLLPLGVLLLSGCNTGIDEHPMCPSDPVYIHFTTTGDFNIDVDITTTRSNEDPIQVGMVGFGYDDTHSSLHDKASTDELCEGMQHDIYTMSPVLDGTYAINPNDGVATPMFPYVENSAVSIHAYLPYTPNLQIEDKQWSIPLDLYSDGAQTNWMYSDTVCYRSEYEGSINLRFKHSLIRLDLIVHYDDYAEMNGSTEDVTPGDDSLDMNGSTEDVTPGDDSLDMNGSTEEITYKDPDNNMGGNTEDVTNGEDGIEMNGENEDENEENDEGTEQFKEEYGGRASGYRGFGTEDTELSITLYTNTDGTAQLMLRDGKLEGAMFGREQDEAYSVSVQRAVTGTTESDKVTFYLLPGTSIYKITVNGTDYYPHNREDETIVDTLPINPGYRREIHITHKKSENN